VGGNYPRKLPPEKLPGKLPQKIFRTDREKPFYVPGKR